MSGRLHGCVAMAVLGTHLRKYLRGTVGMCKIRNHRVLDPNAYNIEAP